MKFTPKTQEQYEQEAQERREDYLWRDGTICDFEILTAVEKSGDYGAYIDANIRVFNNKGKTQDITTFLSDSSDLLLSFCEAVGLKEQFEAGRVDDVDFYGKAGKCRLGIKIGKKKDDGSRWPSRNKIAAFIKPIGGVVAKKQIEAELNDEIPFQP